MRKELSNITLLSSLEIDFPRLEKCLADNAPAFLDKEINVRSFTQNGHYDFAREQVVLLFKDDPVLEEIIEQIKRYATEIRLI